MLGYFSANPLDEVPIPVFPTVCPSCTPPINGQAAGVTVSPGFTRTVTYASQTEQPVRHYDGLPVLFTADIQAGASPYLSWGQTRSWSGLNNSGLAGNGWAINELPYVIVAGGYYGYGLPDTAENPVSAITGDERLTVVAGGTSSYTFWVPEEPANPPTGHVPYGSYTFWGPQSIRLERAPDPDPGLRLTDPQGNVVEFHDVRRDSGGRPLVNSSGEDLAQKYGRFKRYTSADGTTEVEAT